MIWIIYASNRALYVLIYVTNLERATERALSAISLTVTENLFNLFVPTTNKFPNVNMDVFEELEQMALNAAENPHDEVNDTPSAEDISRWQALFHYTYADTVDFIKQHRSNYSRIPVSADHWEMVEAEKVAQGYDREAYEHELNIGGMQKPSTACIGTVATISPAQARAVYVLKLENALNSARKVQEAAGLEEPPPTTQGTTEDDGDTGFCRINGTAKHAILHWLSTHNINYKPTFARVLQKAEKDLSTHSMHPTLGWDATLPQHRSANIHIIFTPTQDQYPVWYFFYGTLADPVTLSRQLPLQERPNLRPATIRGGVLKTWAGKYKALVDGPANALVEGSAYCVLNKEHENALRSYETDNYEVVRCRILFGDGEVQGCTFRFVGMTDAAPLGD